MLDINIVTVIPVRSTSSRLPGKIFLPLLGIPSLEHFIERVKRSRLSPKVVLATPRGDLHNFASIQMKTEILTL